MTTPNTITASTTARAARAAAERVTGEVPRPHPVTGGSALLVAGRLPRPDRFPVEQVEEVALAFRDVVLGTSASLVICSGAAGADLTALSVALALGVPCRVILAGTREAFVAASVAERPGEIHGRTWTEAFEWVLSHPLVEVSSVGEEANDDAFRAVTTALMAELMSEREGVTHRIQVSMTESVPAPRAEHDHTAEAAREAAKAGVAQLHIRTR